MLPSLNRDSLRLVSFLTPSGICFSQVGNQKQENHQQAQETVPRPQRESEALGFTIQRARRRLSAGPVGSAFRPYLISSLQSSYRRASSRPLSLRRQQVRTGDLPKIAQPCKGQSWDASPRLIGLDSGIATLHQGWQSGGDLRQKVPQSAWPRQ